MELTVTNRTGRILKKYLPDVQLICEQCGKVFNLPRIKSGYLRVWQVPRFCGLTCTAIYMRQKKGTGWKHSAESKAKISASSKAVWRRPGMREKMITAAHSPEAREKARLTRLKNGNTYTYSREALSAKSNDARAMWIEYRKLLKEKQNTIERRRGYTWNGLKSATREYTKSLITQAWAIVKQQAVA